MHAPSALRGGRHRYHQQHYHRPQMVPPQQPPERSSVIPTPLAASVSLSSRGRSSPSSSPEGSPPMSPSMRMIPCARPTSGVRPTLRDGCARGPPAHQTRNHHANNNNNLNLISNINGIGDNNDDNNMSDSANGDRHANSSHRQGGSVGHRDRPIKPHVNGRIDGVASQTTQQGFVGAPESRHHERSQQRSQRPFAQARESNVDRRPRASVTVPMLPLCETDEDAQAVRALSGDKRYAVVRRLGSGASSTVFLACDRMRSDALVAIKVVSDAKVSRSEILAGMLLGGHPNMAAMIDWFAARDHYFLVFEHVDGPDMQVLWAGLPATRAFFAEDAFRRVFLCVLDAVAYCHGRGVVHRDIKMENVVVRDEGASACLVDFGFAFFVRPPRALLADCADVPVRRTRDSCADGSDGAAGSDEEDEGHADHGSHSDDSQGDRDDAVGSHSEGSEDEAGDVFSDAVINRRGAGRRRQRAHMRTVNTSPCRPSQRAPRGPRRPPTLDCIYRRNREGMLVAVRMDTPDALNATNAFVGTEEYCAPELTLGALIDPEDLFATDVYSLGVLLHVGLTDRFPQRPTFVQFLVETRQRIERTWHGVDPRVALADPRLIAEINRRGALDLATVPLSIEACDLIGRMLRPVPAERITLDQVCAHPWVLAGRRRHRR